jgi:hypothetical protein
MLVFNYYIFINDFKNVIIKREYLKNIPFKVLSFTMKTMILAGINVIPITKINPPKNPSIVPLVASSL